MPMTQNEKKTRDKKPRRRPPDLYWPILILAFGVWLVLFLLLHLDPAIQPRFLGIRPSGGGCLALWVLAWLYVAVGPSIRECLPRYRFRFWRRVVWLALASSLRSRSPKVLVCYLIAIVGVIVAVPKMMSNQVSGGTLTDNDIRSALVFVAGAVFTALFTFMRVRLRVQGITTSQKETIEESVEIYGQGLSFVSDPSNHQRRVFVVSRCTQFSPYLTSELDRWRRDQYQYSGVNLLLYTVQENDEGLTPDDIVYEIFGGLIRKFRWDGASRKLVDTGIHLYLMPPEVQQDEKATSCPGGFFKPPDYKIVCCNRRAVMAKSIFCPEIDAGAILLDSGVDRQSDWAFSYFLWLFSDHCRWKPVEIVCRINDQHWDWEALASKIKVLLGNRCFDRATGTGGLMDKFHDYCDKEMPRSARREGIQQDYATILQSQEKALEECVDLIITAGTLNSTPGATEPNTPQGVPPVQGGSLVAKADQAGGKA